MFDLSFWGLWAAVIIAATTLAWLFGRSKSPQIQIAWVVAALAVSLMPPLGRQITLPRTIRSVPIAAGPALERPPAPEASSPVAPAPSPAPEPQSIPWLQGLIALWLAGTVAFTARAVRSILVAQRFVRHAKKPEDGMAHADISAPLVAGLPRAHIILPADWPCGLSEQESAAVLNHEEAHVSGRHVLLRTLAEFALAWMWFSPAAWALIRRLDESLEEAADMRAVEQGASAKGLARALVQLADRQVGPIPRFAISSARSGSALEERIKRLKDPTQMTKKARKTATAAVALTALTASAAALTLSANDVTTFDYALEPGNVWEYKTTTMQERRRAPAGGAAVAPSAPAGGGTAVKAPRPAAAAGAPISTTRTSREYAKRKVDVQSGAAVEIEIDYEGVSRKLYRYVQQAPKAILEYGRSSLSGPGIDRVNAPSRVLPLPIVEGDSWKWVAPYRGQTSGAGLTDEERKRLETRYQATVVATAAPVSVPAGTYKAVHLRTESESDAWGKATTDSWYVNGIGLVKTVTKMDGSTSERVLTSFWTEDTD